MRFIRGGEKPEKVFEPRRANVNPKIYVSRRDVEDNLRRGIRGGMHLVLTGDSGTGKSWLYKRLLELDGIKYRTIDCAIVASEGSFDPEFETHIAQLIDWDPTVLKEMKQAELNVVVAKGGAEVTREYEKPKVNNFLKLLVALRAKGDDYFLVIENCEKLFEDSKLINSLGGLITLLDNPDYAKFKVRFLIVGTQREIQHYFERTPALAPVSNRIKEIRQMRPLKFSETLEFLKKGFSLVNIEHSEQELYEFANEVQRITFGVPQRIHEYCLEFCYSLLDGKVGKDAIRDASYKWIEGSMIAFRSIVSKTVKGSKEGSKKLQVLYCFANFFGESMSVSDVEREMRKHFDGLPKNLGLWSIINALVECEIIISRSKDKFYELSDQRLKMILRVLLVKDDELGVRCVRIW